MILVNVKSYEEMKTAVEYTGYKEKFEDEIKQTWSVAYEDKTVVYLNHDNSGFTYMDFKYHDESEAYKKEPILSFQEFKEKYLDTKTDNVNSPSHYKQFSREVIDTMQGVSTPEEFKGYLKLNAIKYLSRYQGKNGAEDLKKAVWYINKLTEVVENEQSKA